MLRKLMIAVLALGWASPMIWAQQEDKEDKDKNEQANLLQHRPFDKPAWQWDANAVIDLWIRGMGRHYDLTDKQREFTRKLMTARVKNFLQNHERDVRSLFYEYLDYQSQQELPPAEAARQFAERAKPLIAEARQEIMEGNMLWRQILTDEQKQKHDRDLEIMKKQFEQMEQGLDRWSKGQVSPEDFPFSSKKDTWRVRKPEDAWDYYVRYFIRSYQLNRAQSQTAFSVLRELREQANRYREAHKNDFDVLEAKHQEIVKFEPKDAKADKDKLKHQQRKIKELEEERRRLERPISVDMFNQLKKRLDTIPTADQRKTREAKLAKMRGKTTTRPSPRSSTQPVTTRPGG